MTDSTTQFLTYLREIGHDIDTGLTQTVLQNIVELLMDIEVSRMIDASHYERNESRVAYRNGYRQRNLKTPLGKLRLNIPKLRKGTYSPEFITDEMIKFLVQFIRQVYVYGVSSRTLSMWDEVEFVQSYITQSELARLHETVDDLISSHKDSAITQEFPYLWLDTFDLHTSHHNRDSIQTAVVAVGFTADGTYELLGFEVASSPHDLFFWRLFLSNLVKRGLTDVQLVVSDAFKGVKMAVADLLDTDWYYSRAHALRRVLDDVPDVEQQAVTDAIAKVFVQPDYRLAKAQMTQTINTFHSYYPSAMMTLGALSGDLLTQNQQIPMFVLALSESLLRIKQAIANHVDAIATSPIDVPMMQDTLAQGMGVNIRYENHFTVYG